MLPTEWTGPKNENTRREPSAGAEPPASPAAPGSSSAPERNIPSESKHVFQARTQVSTPPDRQRTAQACDKCRERKTKCSGDHPVCSRCTTRGLICQYSSREPRPRGPSKAHLRNTVSSVDLHPPQKTGNNAPARPDPRPHQGRSQKSMPEEYFPRSPVENRHAECLPHRASIPQSSHDFPEFRPVPISGPQEFSRMAVLGYEPYGGTTTTRSHQIPQPQFSDHKQQQWHEVPRIQTHLTIDGRIEEDTAMQFGLHGPPLPAAGPNSYGPFSLHGRVSPTFQYPLPLLERAVAAQLEPQKTQHVEQVYSWGYHSDGGSSGSSTGESLTYSPSSSEDALEPRSRSTSSLGFGSSGSLDLAQASISHQQSPFRYSALDDMTAYSTQAASPSLLPFGAFPGVTMDPDQDIQAGMEFTYPPPTVPLGVNILQDVNLKEGFFDYLDVDFQGGGGNFADRGITSSIESVGGR